MNVSHNQTTTQDLHEVKKLSIEYTEESLGYPESDQWIYDLTNWRRIIENWEKESQLIFKLVGLATLGQDNTPTLDFCVNQLKIFFQKEIETLREDLFVLEYRTQKRASNKQHYERKFQQRKQQLKEVANNYDQLKYKVLEEIARSFPLTII